MIVWSRLSGESGPALRLVVGLGGLCAFGVGVAAVFETSNQTGAAALVTVGAVLVLFALLGDRVGALELGSAKLGLRDLARDRFGLAREKEIAGDTAAALKLRNQGSSLQRLANDYAYIRRSQHASLRRTKALEAVMAKLGELALEQEFDPGDVWDWFDRGDLKRASVRLA